MQCKQAMSQSSAADLVPLNDDLNTVKPHQKTMAANKDDQFVPESVEGRSQHDSKVKSPITTEEQILPYSKIDHRPYDIIEVVPSGRNKNRALYDNPANDK